ncbi:MAG: glutathione S-transferase [Woeseia sp.]|nr:glutathione S-transferase [Woeseia sp.]MBT6211466.1 glutathione S-transferase [Woeseia sp.]
MPNYKLTYFDFDGGRGEPVRIAFHAAGIDFEDKRISFPEFGEMRKDMRFNSTPELEIDGIVITQSNSINRYVGKLAGLYPEDDMQALYCDETMDALEDLLHYIVQTFGLEGDALRQAREKLAEGWLSVYVRGLGDLLARGGGEYFADNRLTMADIKVFVQVSSLVSGTLDHVPTDIVARLAPSLLEHQDRVQSDPVITGYYTSRA